MFARLRAKSLIFALCIGILGGSLKAMAPSVFVEKSPAQNLYDVFWGEAAHELSAMLFYQQAFGDDLTYLDGSFLAYYQTGRFNGVSGGLGFILAGPLFSVRGSSSETYDDVKQIFLLNSAYVDYKNDKLGLQAVAGRYKANEEWNTYYSQGFGVSYDIGQLASLNLTASYGSALVLNEYVTAFRSDLSSFGTYFLRARFYLPYHIDLEPYLYATGYFTTFGMKTSIDYNFMPNLSGHTRLHIAGYSKYYPTTLPTGLNHKFELAAASGRLNQDMSGIAWLEQGVKWYDVIEGKVGIVGVSGAGAELIDYYGHTTPFEYNVGMFWSNAVSIYASSELNWNHIFEVEAGIRGTFMPNGNVVNFEVKGLANFPIWRQRGSDGIYRTYMTGKVGISAVGVYNTSPAINFYGGENYTLIRAFVRVSI